MSKHVFELRLGCTYADPDNSVDQLTVDVLNEDGWESLDINTGSPGFLLFNCALFSCQHLYFRANAAERGLMLASSKGKLKITADSEWKIEFLHIDFIGRLKSGAPDQAAIDYIIGRMGHCPVSSNLSAIENRQISVSFE